MRAEVICKTVAAYPPTHAGEADLNAPVAKQRKFGLIWPGASQIVNSDAYIAGAKFFQQQLQKCGISLGEDNKSFPIVDPNGPADAQTLMAKFKQDGVTTVILVSDPIDPVYLTNAASKQQYFREWFNTGRDAQTENLVSTVSGATRLPGKYSATWNGRDGGGRVVDQGTYRVFIEAAREHGSYQLMQKELALGTAPVSADLPGNEEIAGARVEYRRRK